MVPTILTFLLTLRRELILTCLQLLFCVSRYGWTALHYASTEGNFSIVEYLIGRGANVAARDKDGTTAAFRAKSLGHDDVVCLLESTGCDDLLLVTDDEASAGEYKHSESIYSRVCRRGFLETSSQNTSDANWMETMNYERIDLAHLQFEEPTSPELHGESDYQVGIATKSDTKPTGSGGDREDDKKSKIRSLISSQLQDMFDDGDPYENPLGTNDSEQKQEQEDVFVSGIGYNTLKNVMREEIKKFMSESVKRKSHNVPTTIPDVNENDEGIYEKIWTSSAPEESSLNQSRSDGTTILRNGGNSAAKRENREEKDRLPLPSYPPPLPPPRNSVSLNKDADSSSPAHSTDSQEKRRALHVLKRIEHSNTVMEACFKVLVERLSNDTWKQLAYQLPLRKGREKVDRQIKLIEKRHQDNVKLKVTALLGNWRSYKGESANMDALIAALHKCSLSQLVTEVERASDEFTA